MNMKIASLKMIEKRLLKQVPSLAFCGSGTFFLLLSQRLWQGMREEGGSRPDLGLSPDNPSI
jgi:hypothetical protein